MNSPEPKTTKVEDPRDRELRRPQHVLARVIGGALVVSIGYAGCKLLGIELRRFGPFMMLMVVGSFLGNVVGVFLAHKMARR